MIQQTRSPQFEPLEVRNLLASFAWVDSVNARSGEGDGPDAILAANRNERGYQFAANLEFQGPYDYWFYLIGARGGWELEGSITDLSPDGTAGGVYVIPGDTGRPFIITENRGFEWIDLIIPNAPGRLSGPVEVSNDGQSAFVSDDLGVYKWTPGLTYAVRPFEWEYKSSTTGGSLTHFVGDVSPDGAWIVGGGSTSDSGPTEAFRWSENTGFDFLGPGWARAVSADGQVVVGNGRDGAFRWENGDHRELHGFVESITTDGALTYGHVEGHAVVWDSQGEPCDLRYAVGRSGIDLEVYGVSVSDLRFHSMAPNGELYFGNARHFDSGTNLVFALELTREELGDGQACEPVSDIEAQFIRAASNGIFEFGYEISGSQLPGGARAGFVWGSGPLAADALGFPFYETALSRSVGAYGPINIPVDSMSTRPNGATHVLMFLDIADTIAESDETNNFRSVRIPTVTTELHVRFGGRPYLGHDFFIEALVTNQSPMPASTEIAVAEYLHKDFANANQITPYQQVALGPGESTRLSFGPFSPDIKWLPNETPFSAADVLLEALGINLGADFADVLSNVASVLGHLFVDFGNPAFAPVGLLSALTERLAALNDAVNRVHDWSSEVDYQVVESGRFTEEWETVALAVPPDKAASYIEFVDRYKTAINPFLATITSMAEGGTPSVDPHTLARFLLTHLAAARTAYIQAADPPDPRFEETASLEDYAFSVAGLELPVADRRDAELQVALYALHRAEAVSRDRAVGAQLAGEPFWQSEQLLLASRYASDAATMWSLDPVLSDTWPYDIDVLPDSLPAVIDEVLQSFGWTAAEISGFYAAVRELERHLIGGVERTSSSALPMALLAARAVDDLKTAIEIRVQELSQPVVALPEAELQQIRQSWTAIQGFDGERQEFESLVSSYIETVRTAILRTNSLKDLQHWLERGYTALVLGTGRPEGANSALRLGPASLVIQESFASFLVDDLPGAAGLPLPEGWYGISGGEIHLTISRFPSPGQSLPGAFVLDSQNVEQGLGIGVVDSVTTSEIGVVFEIADVPVSAWQVELVGYLWGDEVGADIQSGTDIADIIVGVQRPDGTIEAVDIGSLYVDKLVTVEGQTEVWVGQFRSAEQSFVLSEESICVLQIRPIAEAIVDGIFAIDDFRFEAIQLGFLAGDYNGNGLVEQGDLDLVLGTWGSKAGDVPESWVNDLPVGIVDQAELDKVLGNWGRTAESPAPASATPAPHAPLTAARAAAAKGARTLALHRGDVPIAHSLADAMLSKLTGSLLDDALFSGQGDWLTDARLKARAWA
jgi:hypothetical protein